MSMMSETMNTTPKIMANCLLALTKETFLMDETPVVTLLNRLNGFLKVNFMFVIFEKY